MKTKKLSLDAAVDLRERLDQEIHENYRIIISNNSVEENKNEVDVLELLSLTTAMESQVIRIKEAIQEANLSKHPWDRHSNSYYIYRLSQLKIRKNNLLKMSVKEGKYGKKVYVATIKQKELNRMLTDINDQIDKISQKLSKFNTLRKNQIKVQWEDELLYLLN